MADLAQGLALRTALSHAQADVLAHCWALLAAERGWSEEQTERIAMACAMAGVHPYDLRRALAPVRIGWRIEMTDLPTVPPTRCAVPPPPPPPPQGWRETEMRRVALHLAVQPIEATSVIGGWVDGARTAVLCTADAYLAWLTGKDGSYDDQRTARLIRERDEARATIADLRAALRQSACRTCAGSGYELGMNDRPTGNPCQACASEATDV